MCLWGVRHCTSDIHPVTPSSAQLAKGGSVWTLVRPTIETTGKLLKFGVASQVSRIDIFDMFHGLFWQSTPWNNMSFAHLKFENYFARNIPGPQASLLGWSTLCTQLPSVARLGKRMGRLESLSFPISVHGSPLNKRNPKFWWLNHLVIS